MQFRLSEELMMIRSVVGEFAVKEVLPTAQERDEAARFDRNVLASMSELGLTGIPWAEDFGDEGGDFLALAIAIEEISKVCASTGSMLAAHTGHCGYPISGFASEMRKRRLLPSMANATLLGTCCFNGLLTASMAAGGRIKLNGSCKHVGMAGEADIYIVFADDGCAYVVEKGIPGMSFSKKDNKLGLRSFPSGEVRLKHCVLEPDEQQSMLGSRGEGPRIAQEVRAIKDLTAAAVALGTAQGALEAATDYSLQRQQFGKPIGLQQAISFKLADMDTGVEAARQLVYQAAWRKDAGLPFGEAAAMSRRFAADTAAWVTVEAVQVFGGYGYMREYAVERYMRDAKYIQADDGRRLHAQP
jgi:butyryl-CoA dehydrogenase